MSTLTQFFGGGGGGGGGYIEAKVLVVGGGGGGYCRRNCSCAPPTQPNLNANQLCFSYGSAGGVAFVDGILKPGDTCPIQVGAGTTTTVISCTWCSPTCGSFFYFHDGGPGGSSYFGGTGGICAGGGILNWTPSPTHPCPNAGSLATGTGAKSLGPGGTKNIDKFQSGFESAGNRSMRISTCVGGPDSQTYFTSPSISTCDNVVDSGFETVNTNSYPGPGTKCPSAYSQYYGLYHELLGPGNSQIVGAGKFGFYTCKCTPAFNCINSYCAPILCPTTTDAVKNFGGFGNGTGSGGLLPCIGGCPGSVIVQYPNDYDAVPAPNRPGSVDCSPNTPGFYTYYYLTPGSITLP